MVSGSSMEPRMHTGDLVIGREQSSDEVGDAVASRVPHG
jgi:signal peptidase I